MSELVHDVDLPDPPVSGPPNLVIGSPSQPSSISAADLSVDPISFLIPAEIPSSAAPSYTDRFKSSLRNLRKISSPSYLEDGTLVMEAPASIHLQKVDQCKGYIVAHFHGLAPPPDKIYADLNPAWGKFGNISVRHVSKSSCLILIPSIQTREWVLQTGYWQAGNCSFTVPPWSRDGCFQVPDLETAPTWAVLKPVPLILYSLDGICVTASAIGEPLHTDKSRLEPYRYGDTKVKDNVGNTVSIDIEYPHLPPTCCNCGRFGHLRNRCPHPFMKKPIIKIPQAGIAVANTKISLENSSFEEQVVDRNSLSPPSDSQSKIGEKELLELPASTINNSIVSKSAAEGSVINRRSRSPSPSKGKALSSPPVVPSHDASSFKK
ncbi:hypothetical protein EUTSA_v10023807mg, partial [Eutrema salsugineum]